MIFSHLRASGGEVQERLPLSDQLAIPARPLLAIASAHSTASHADGTDWDQIVELYDMLMTIRPSAIVELNRAVAIAQLNGPERGLEAMCAIQDQDRLKSYPFYFAALGELESQCGRHVTASGHFQEAVRLARNSMERRFFEQRINELGRRSAE
jgi:RNA polymerase sigma-70 factor (ECF subfamily)